MAQEFTLSNHGYWVGTEIIEEHMFDAQLADALVTFFSKDDSVLDLGCGMGDYVKHLRKAGIECEGIDGNPSTPELSDGICQTADLATPLEFTRLFDWALSLEVAEHIPRKYERPYLQNLDAANRKGIVMSWAIPGQTGLGHVNCRDNEYVRCRLEAMGYQELTQASQELRSNSTLEWFKHTVMVFKRIMPADES